MARPSNQKAGLLASGHIYLSEWARTIPLSLGLSMIVISRELLQKEPFVACCRNEMQAPLDSSPHLQALSFLCNSHNNLPRAPFDLPGRA